MGKKRVISRNELRGEEKFRQAIGKKIKARNLTQARVYVHASYNNTILTLSDREGKVLSWISTGMVGFSGPKRSTPYAAMQAAKALSAKIEGSGIKDLEIYVKGIGSGREATIRALAGEGFNITFIKDITPIPFGGPRPPKPRRV